MKIISVIVAVLGIGLLSAGIMEFFVLLDWLVEVIKAAVVLFAAIIVVEKIICGSTGTISKQDCI